MQEKITTLPNSDAHQEQIRNEHNQEYKNWCERKLANYYTEWQAVLNGKYDQNGTLWQHGVTVEVKTPEQKRKYVAIEIADMANDVQGNFFHGGYGWYSDDEIKENLNKIKEKLLLTAEKLNLTAELKEQMPQKKEKKKPTEVPEWLKL